MLNPEQDLTVGCPRGLLLDAKVRSVLGCSWCLRSYRRCLCLRRGLLAYYFLLNLGHEVIDLADLWSGCGNFVCNGTGAGHNGSGHVQQLRRIAGVLRTCRRRHAAAGSWALAGTARGRNWGRCHWNISGYGLDTTLAAATGFEESALAVRVTFEFELATMFLGGSRSAETAFLASVLHC